MHDIRLIREHPDAFDAAMTARGLEPQSATLLELDTKRRTNVTELEQLRQRRNELSREIGQLKSRLRAQREVELEATNYHEKMLAGSNVQNTEIEEGFLVNEVTSNKTRVADLEVHVDFLDGDLAKRLASLPNLPASDVPIGADESSNRRMHSKGLLPNLSFEPRDHDAIGPALGLDFETGAAMSGARFTLLRGHMARLSRALGQFMLDRLTDLHGYELVQPPLLVRDAAVFGTGQLPKFADDLFRTTDGRWLIPTAEVSLTNIVRESILTESELPLRFAALTPCFRSEAGAAGRDTRGFIRQHQFDKVEMVSIVTPDASDAEHERMTACAEGILEALGLPYRRMLLCTGDMGFTARRTYDLEVWLPGQGQYREISSCSTCGDFQARRMNARYRPEGGKPQYVHTLNGSGLAVGRTLVAVVENYQQEDGSVVVPEVLRPYLGGAERLEPR